MCHVVHRLALADGALRGALEDEEVGLGACEGHVEEIVAIDNLLQVLLGILVGEVGVLHGLVIGDGVGGQRGEG